MFHKVRGNILLGLFCGFFLIGCTSSPPTQKSLPPTLIPQGATYPNPHLISSGSNRNTPISAEEATQIISDLPIIQTYLQEVGSTAHVTSTRRLFDADANEYYWGVKVYEYHIDEDMIFDNTFNWYRVYEKTGTIKTEF